MTAINIVWNNDKTEGFATTDAQLAYEARKGSDSNCCKEDGSQSKLAVAFCDIYSSEEDCTIETISSIGCKLSSDYRQDNCLLKDLRITSYQLECDSDVQSFLVDFYKVLVLNRYQLLKVTFINHWFMYIYITENNMHRFWSLEVYSDSGKVKQTLSGEFTEDSIDKLQDCLVMNSLSAHSQRHAR